MEKETDVGEGEALKAGCCMLPCFLEGGRGLWVVGEYG